MSDLRMTESDLVVVDDVSSGDLARIVDAIWYCGATLMCLDQRQAPPEREALLSRVQPSVIWESTGPVRVSAGKEDPEVALLVATSGTSGEPKLVELTRDAVTAAVAASTSALGATADDAWLCCLPVAHIAGLLVVLRAALTGARVVVHDRFDLEAICELDGISFVSVVPTMLRRMIAAGVDLSSYKAVLTGGGGIESELAPLVVRTYGLTESCGGVVYDGRPLPGVDVRIVDDEIVLYGPMLMRGYRGVSGSAPVGGLRTGDIGRIEDGVLFVGGRADDMIRTGAEKVWPTEVENVLRQHPDIADAAVAGVPDPDWGHRVVAWIVPTTPGLTVELEAVRDFVGERIARFKAPRELVIVIDLPRTASGKVQRHKLSI